MISLIQALPPDKFNFMYEKEKETIKELSRLVKKEEEKINDLRRKVWLLIPFFLKAQEERHVLE